MAQAKSGTLTPGEVATVEIDNHNGGVWIVIRDPQPGQVIWVRADGTDPAVGGDGTFVVVGARRMAVAATDAEPAVVKLISGNAVDYTVEAVG